MESEDKKIKELLEKGFFEKAPEGFTQRVMHSVEQVEIQHSRAIFSGVLGYVLLTLGAIVVSFGIITYIDNDFLVSYIQSVASGIAGLEIEFSKTGHYFLSLPTQIPYFGLLTGIFIAILALLVLEKYILSGKRTVHLFV